MYGDLDFHSLKQPVPGPFTEFLSERARKHSFFIIAGMPERGAGKNLHNTSVMVDDKGTILAKHRKVQVYTFLGEEKVWTPGDNYTVVDTKFGRVGLLVCYDGDFPESWRINALKGADMVFHISAYESPCEDWWDKFYPAAALQNVIWAVLCNTVGDTVLEGKPLHLFGRSRIIAPDGEIEAEAPYVSPGGKSESYLLVKTVKAKQRLEEARRKYGNFVRDRRPEIYSVLIEPRAVMPQ
jgi:predicted amidohydrolase